jgi:hypothetical protein
VRPEMVRPEIIQDYAKACTDSEYMPKSLGKRHSRLGQVKGTMARLARKD